MRRERFYLLLLAACSALVYANALSGPFVFDDEILILDNENIRQLWPPSWAMPNDSAHAAINSRLLTSLSLAFNYALGGLRVEGYRLFNLAMHILCGLALFGVLRLLFGRIVGLADRAAELALASALLWSVHPLNSEVINYITQRSESLMAACYLGTLYCFLRDIAAAERRWQIGAVLCCALGMTAKEVMVSAPLAVLLCDGLVVSGSYRLALQLRSRLYGGLAVGWLVLVHGLWTRPHGAAIGFGLGVDVWTYLLNQSQMIATYLGLVLWPYPLALDYGIPRLLTLGDVWLESAVVLGLLIGSGVAVYRRQLWGFIGVFVFMLLAPTSSFVPILTEVGAERRMYLPLAALSAGLVVAADLLCGRWVYGRRIGVVVVGLLALVLGYSTLRRNSDYASVVEIWQSAAVAVEDNPRVHYNLGINLVAAGRSEQALASYRRALALATDNKDVHNNLGMLLVARGEPALALDHYRRAIELDPGFVKAEVNLGLALMALDRSEQALPHFRRAVTMDPASHWARYNLALALERRGEWKEAVVHYRWALGIDPNQAKVQYRLGLTYLADGRLANAVYHLRQALVLAPDYGATHFHLGRALSRLDSTAAGLAHYRQAIALDSTIVEAQYNLATELMKMGDVAAALPHLQRVVALSPALAEARNNLGIALQLAGRRDAAVAEFRRAVQLDPDYAEARTNLNAALRYKGSDP